MEAGESEIQGPLLHTEDVHSSGNHEHFPKTRRQINKKQTRTTKTLLPPKTTQKPKNHNKGVLVHHLTEGVTVGDFLICSQRRLNSGPWCQGLCCPGSEDVITSWALDQFSFRESIFPRFCILSPWQEIKDCSTSELQPVCLLPHDICP